MKHIKSTDKFLSENQGQMKHDDMGLKYHYKIIEKGKKEPFFEGLNSSLDGTLAGIKGILLGITSRESRINFKIEINIEKPIEEIIRQS